MLNVKRRMLFAVLFSKEMFSSYCLFNNLKIISFCLFLFGLVVFHSVFTNGEVLVPPAIIRIPKYTLTSWENVLTMVTEKVRLRTGAVYR